MASQFTDDGSGPVYFWGEQETEPYPYLSQWYPSSFTHDGLTYDSTEHWMMAQKAAVFGDDKILKEIAGTSDPAVHKQLGRQVKGFTTGKWNKHKFNVVRDGNVHKFTQCKAADGTPLKDLLLATGERELVEASPHDRIWGIGYSAADAGQNRKDWGENLLGKALMEVRSQLRQ